ncbi:MAG: DUF4389 domain-containing protein [Acidimicrobiia bacterium]|nr:DUF4389 domain-containing protein [Acidimicrobiia bacterium]
MIVSGAIAVVMWLIVVFTGRLPQAIADLQAMTMRDWVMRSIRVNARLSAYHFLLTDDYPPFETD